MVLASDIQVAQNVGFGIIAVAIVFVSLTTAGAGAQTGC